MFWGFILLAAAAGYLLGNCNGAILTTKMLHKEDIRNSGSGNAGLTNFLRSSGGAATLVVLLIDVAKAVLASLLGGWLLSRFGHAELGKMVGGAFCVIGHMFPVFFQFRGGKGILCGAALAGAMDLWLLAALLAVFLLVVAFSRYVSLGSCICAVIYGPLYSWRFWGMADVCAIATLIGLLALFMHRKNILRLLRGEENKLSFRKRAKEE